MLNGKIDTDCGGFMRHIIAQHVENDKETYNEAILGRPNAEYCQWIQQPDVIYSFDFNYLEKNYEINSKFVIFRLGVVP